MSDLTEVMAEMQSAATTQFADAEIKGAEACEDGTYNVTVNVKTGRDMGTCTDADNGDEHTMEDDMSVETGASDDDQERAGDDDGWGTHPSLRDSEDQDSTPEDSEDSWTDETWNTIQQAARVVEEKTDQSRPDDRGKAEYAEWLDALGVNIPDNTEDLDESEPESDAKDESDTQDAKDTETDTNGVNDGVSDEYLIKHGVSPEDVEDVKHFRQENGVCDGEGCEHGANKDSDTCYEYPNCDTSSKKDIKGDREVSDLSDAEKKSALQLIEDEDEPDVNTLKEAIPMV